VTCREIEEWLIPSLAGGAVPPEAAAHFAGCETCRKLVAAMGNRAAPDLPSLDRLLEIKAQLRSNLKPVKPLPHAGLFSASFLLVSALIVAVGAAYLGTAGWLALDPFRKIAVFLTLGLDLAGIAILMARENMPGSRVLLPPGLAVATVLGTPAVIFATLFNFHQERSFMATGLVCLRIGLVCALPVGVICWLILRRGLVLNRAAAGALTGLLAGLSALTLLEIFCPNPDKYHILVWHIGVAVLAMMGGAATGWILDSPPMELPRQYQA
jgi:hypothetical protein